ncbi:hypothetical protein F7725_016074 [Dissostichus mawsoni]|uniref:Ig-like domain-containing protein n=1 Tax=Dissostichus mawsoni TaxID=36200 RepID=A0A7J5Y3L9_DISMA|nr:hypothetical protein F7725_016074 [Dissostichus mawsoni]
MEEHKTVNFMRLLSDDSTHSTVSSDSCEYYQTEIFDLLPSIQASRPEQSRKPSEAYQDGPVPGEESVHGQLSSGPRDKAPTQPLRNMVLCIQGKRSARERRKMQISESWRRSQSIKRKRTWAQIGGALSGLWPWQHTLHAIEDPLKFGGNDSVLDFFLGSGYLDRSPVFYGFYTRGSLNLQCLNTPLLYLAGILTILFLSLILVVRRTMVGYKHTWMLGKRYSMNVSYKIFCGWDFTIQDPAAAALKRSFIRNDLKLFLEEQSFSRREAQRTLRQRVRLYLLRFFLNLVVLALLGGAFYLIYFATKTSQNEIGHNWLVSLVLESIFVKLASLGIYIFFIFKTKQQFSVLRCCVAEQRMFRGSSSSVLFHFMSSCGPFGNEQSVFNVTGVCVDSLPGPAQSTLRYLASSAFALPLILAEILILTSYVSRGRANQKAIERLKDMLVMSSSDKRFLVKQHITMLRPLASFFIRLGGSISIRPVLTGPVMAYLGSRVALRCIAPDSSLPVTYELMGGDGVLMATVADLKGEQPASFYLKPNMYCIFSSPPVYVSKPRISFSISNPGASPSGNVTCWSTRGSPPVNISLLLDDKEVGSVTATESLAAWFSVAVVPGLNMGTVRCRVNTEVQKLMSEPLTLEVVPVGGDVKVEVEYLYRADSKLTAARLSCGVSRGTFPEYSWLLNDSVLPPETHRDSHIQPDLPHYALTDHRRILVLPKFGPEESGYYRCRARDSYNDSGHWVESEAVQVQVTEVFMNTIEILTIAFCCFHFVTLAVALHCIYKKFDQNQGLFCCSKESSKVDDRGKVLAFYTSLNGEVANFPILVQPNHEGNLECVAKAQNNSDIEPTVSYTQYLKVLEPVKEAEIVVHSGPKTTSEDSGSYMCIATNHLNETDVFSSNSSEVVITVKDLVSIPDISFTVLKEDSHNYSAVVACQTAKGSPPVTFSLYNRTELVANTTVDDRNATFKLPLVLDRPMGWLQCQANNGDRIEYSQWIPLEVVPVGGPVTMHYDYDIGENYAVIDLRFYCKAVKGSFPRYQWFLNKTLLHGRGSFYYVVNQHPGGSILLLSVGRSSAGTYHCEVSDSFDNATTISSKKLYMDKEGPRQYGEKTPLSFEMEGMMTAYEDELASEASVDEWPQIEKEKKTLEDEPFDGP